MRSKERQQAGDKGSPVYKFRSFNLERDTDPEWQGYAASLLRDNLIYCPSPIEFNDPWEGRPAFIAPDRNDDSASHEAFVDSFMTALPPNESRADVERFIAEFGYDKATREMQDVLANMLCKFGVFSVAGNCEEPLLWSYYASGHRGYCWQFDQTKRPFNIAINMTYSPTYPLIDWARWSEQDVTSLAMLTKAKFWSHENEYRVVVPPTPSQLFPVTPHNNTRGQQPRGRFLKIDSTALTGVVFGVGMDPRHKAEIIRMASAYDRPLQFMHAGVHRREYKVVVVTLQNDELERIQEKARKLPPL